MGPRRDDSLVAIELGRLRTAFTGRLSTSTLELPPHGRARRQINPDGWRGRGTRSSFLQEGVFEKLALDRFDWVAGVRCSLRARGWRLLVAHGGQYSPTFSLPLLAISGDFLPP